MDKELLDFASTKVDQMLSAPSASEETKRAAQAWKDAIAAGKDADAATNTLLDAISEHQTTIDDLIAFAGSDTGRQVFGEEGAAKMLAHSQARKEAGRCQVLRLRRLQALPRAAAQVWPRGGGRLPVGNAMQGATAGFGMGDTQRGSSAVTRRHGVTTWLGVGNISKPRFGQRNVEGAEKSRVVAIRGDCSAEGDGVLATIEGRNYPVVCQ
jgi:hypothetical protein